MRIQLKNVSKRFGALVALDDVTLTIPAGARVALAGPNGSGKSTLVRAVVGLTPCRGVTVDGIDPFVDRLSIASRLAYVPQAAPLVSAPVGELIEVVAALRGIVPLEIRRVAGALGLPIDLVDRRPLRALSGGMKQKFLVALALAAPVSLVVFDEPTASLDASARSVFFDLCRERLSGATVLVSSHRPDEVAELADRVVTLLDGRIQDDQPAAAWLARRYAGTSLQHSDAHIEARPQEVGA
jgi:ABC-type multidrug transport system ATPase subunit